MSKMLKRIESLIPFLPGKDAHLARKFLENRNFEGILELVESDLYKAEKAKTREQKEIPDDYTTALTELKGELMSYISLLEVPDNSEDYEYY